MASFDFIQYYMEHYITYIKIKFSDEEQTIYIDILVLESH